MKKMIMAMASTLTMSVSLGTALMTGVAQAAPVRTAQAAGAASATSCHRNWGTGAKAAGQMVQTKVLSVRAGEHTCFDRLVIDLGVGPQAGYRVRYVKKIVQDASGQVIPVKGKGKILITVLAPAGARFPANSHHLVKVTGFKTFRQVVGAGSFEGITSIGLGVRAKGLPFRVFRLAGPGHRSRIVVDVANVK
jgi:hypothetical protein